MKIEWALYIYTIFDLWEIIPRGCFNTFSEYFYYNQKTVHLLSTTILYTIKVLNVVFDLSSS